MLDLHHNFLIVTVGNRADHLSIRLCNPADFLAECRTIIQMFVHIDRNDAIKMGVRKTKIVIR